MKNLILILTLLLPVSAFSDGNELHDFSSVEGIFQANCVRCHSGPRAPHNIDLTSYDLILNPNLFPPLIVKGDPEASSLYTTLFLTAKNPMPRNADLLSDEDRLAIYNWIKDGALEFSDEEDGD